MPKPGSCFRLFGHIRGAATREKQGLAVEIRHVRRWEGLREPLQMNDIHIIFGCFST